MEFNSTFGSNNQGVQIGNFFDKSGEFLELVRIFVIQLKIKQGKHDERQIITDWLSPIDFRKKQEDVHVNWQAGTGEWFLCLEAFQAWKEGKNNVLWCHGMRESK